MTRAAIQIERQTSIDGTSNLPGWWTPVRRAAMEALVRRSEIRVRMAGPGGPGREDQRGQRWRPHAHGMKTRHLFDVTGKDLNSGNVGPAIRNLIDWGYIYKLSTTVSQVQFTPKGWAWLAAEGLIEPAWLELIFERSPVSRDVAWSLYRKMRDSRKLAALAQPSEAFVEKVIDDIMEPAVTDIPYTEPTEDEIPGLPQFDEEVEGILRDRAHNEDEVARIRMSLARQFHFNTSASLKGVEPKELFDAIGRHFSSDEMVRADLELIRDQRQGPRDTYFSRELVRRMSEAGEFQRHTLADHVDDGLARQPGMHGVSRIAAALEAGELREAGLARGMGPGTTLGDVHDRLRAESVSAMASDEPEPVEATPENIEAANAAAKAEDDALPMVDWIERRLSQYNYDDWVPKGNAALVAREAVLRHMRQNPAGVRVVGEGNVTQYDGFRLHVRRNISALDGRSATLTLSIDSDYDEKDTANIEAWFDRLVEGRGRQYAYPAGANVDHQVVGEVEDIRIRAINPLWMIAMSFGSALLALVLFVVLLSLLPPLNPGA